MTDTSAAPTPPPTPPPPAGQSPAPRWRTLLYILIPIVGALLLIGAFVAALWGRSGPVDQSADLAAGTSLSVELPNAVIILEPSTDDEVHVRMTGSYFGTEPTLSARTDGGVTEVRGGCRAQFFSRCSVTVTVQLPTALPVTAAGENGRIAASGLTGRVTLTTTNGGIETDGTVGPVDLQSTNGDIRVTDAVSKSVAAATTNGSVSLQFVDAPESVEAGSTNGEIIVRVPVGGVTYRVTAQTTNGTVTDDTVPTDSTSRRSITARTTNGSITVEGTR
ncbi:DUF4097 and DUF4098 domain-containing protein YvlB [Cryobacterium sp. MP_3.1]|uniref:DUF4097 family beta strand repeat-containing protein n=1 Tax=Cryobacterium sp. MP_3.1 TaxID=3071711 RepID=UPI002E086DD7|nr:DUF4097 and DUF4098 domain-containing protein YvlB [Cryobacterium sp. MP_3.1]